MPENVVPESAVDVFFERERERERQRKASKKKDSKNSCFKSLIRKHSTNLKVLKTMTDKNPDRKSSHNQGDAQKQPKRQLSKPFKESCEMMRVFLFGFIGNESAETEEDKEAIFSENIGSRELVHKLFHTWTKLDDDNSGRVDLGEFRTFANEHIKAKAAEFAEQEIGNHITVMAQEDPAKFVTKFCTRLEKGLLNKKSSFSIEDMMKLTWPAATVYDLRTMVQWCHDLTAQAKKARIQPPPVMAKAELDGLTSVFHIYDDDGSGSLQIDELIKKGVIDVDNITSEDQCYLDDGEVDLLEFCEMMCPAGYRATPQSKVGTLPDGRRVVLDEKLNCWRMAGSADKADQPDLT